MPPRSRQQAGTICFATDELAGSGANGGTGPHVWQLSKLLARRDWEVHILFCGEVDETRFREGIAASTREGIAVHLLEHLGGSPGAGIRHYGGDADVLVLGERVLAALEALHAKHGFDLVEFPDRGALGLRSVQSRSAGDGLVDVPLAVKLHGPTQWLREGNLQLRTAPRELKVEFCERHAFERADVQLSSSHYLLDQMRTLDWAIRDDAVVACPLPEPEAEPVGPPAGIGELAFVGRLDRRNGLHLFLDALDSVAPEMPALFLGEDAQIDGSPASELIVERLGDRPHRIESDLDRGAALEELSRGDRLVVMPSLREASGLAAAECIVNRIPLLASRTEAVTEIFDQAEDCERWLFEPTVAGLRDALDRRLGAPEAEELELRARAAAAIDSERCADRVETAYRGLVARPRPDRVRASGPVTVTIAVAHYNHDRFLPGALSSLAAQTRPAEEVVVVDDGSTSEAARQVFAEQESLYPGWTFLRQENSGPGATRNRVLEGATSTYFLPFDSDNVATPRLVERLVEAMERNPSRAATTCHNLAFVEDADIERGDFAFRYAPTGGPLLSACLENVYGDTCALFRAESLRSVGGFEGHRWSPYEDWETFVKMTLSGLEVEVLPQPLFYYRTGSGGRLQVLTADPATEFRQRAHLIERFFGDAKLSRRDRRDLWECLLAFDRLSTKGLAEQLEEQRLWHDSQMADLRDFRLRQLDELRTQLGAAVEAQRVRAEAAEGELASLKGLTPRRLLRRLARGARRRLSRSSGPPR